MKTTICLLFGLCLSAQAFIVPTNPPPVVQLAWNASPSPGITNYYMYYGNGSAQYTVKVACGPGLTTTISNLTRGVTYFFAVTANDNRGMESVFSNEVNYTVPNPPLPPTLNPVVALHVQTKTSVDGQWADAGMEWSIPPNKPEQLFRLQASLETPTAAERIADMKLRVVPPPIPGK